MSEKQQVLQAIAASLLQAERTRVGTAPISRAYPHLTVDDAYRIQLLNIDAKLRAGQRVTGKKIGLTSPAMQNLLGVHQPDYGHLLHSMDLSGRPVPPDVLMQPKIEGEIAFMLHSDLVGTGNTAEDVLAATNYVMPALEIVDSRVADWKITIVDTVADNASSGMYVLGSTRTPPDRFPLAREGMKLYKNGQLMNQGLGDAVLGDPAHAVAWLANMMNSFGVPLKAGEVILSGALTAALPVAPGDRFEAVFDNLGSVQAVFEGKEGAV